MSRSVCKLSDDAAATAGMSTTGVSTDAVSTVEWHGGQHYPLIVVNITSASHPPRVSTARGGNRGKR